MSGDITLPVEVVKLAQDALDTLAALPFACSAEQRGAATGKAAGAAMRLRLWVRDAQREQAAEVAHA